MRVARRTDERVTVLSWIPHATVVPINMGLTNLIYSKLTGCVIVKKHFFSRVFVSYRIDRFVKLYYPSKTTVTLFDGFNIVTMTVTRQNVEPVWHEKNSSLVSIRLTMVTQLIHNYCLERLTTI